MDGLPKTEAATAVVLDVAVDEFTADDDTGATPKRGLLEEARTDIVFGPAEDEVVAVVDDRLAIVDVTVVVPSFSHPRHP